MVYRKWTVTENNKSPDPQSQDLPLSELSSCTRTTEKLACLLRERLGHHNGLEDAPGCQVAVHPEISAVVGVCGLGSDD